MSEKHDIYFRAHTVVLDKPAKSPKKRLTSPRPKGPKWPKYALVCDTESRIDLGQELTFGFYRILELKGKAYEIVEEGAFFDDNLPVQEREVLEQYIRNADLDTKSFPPRFPLYSRSEFITTVF